MSKLSKFKVFISPAEAAELLSRLIEESVSVADLRSMYSAGWLTASYSCMATIVRLKPQLEADLHTQQVRAGQYWMEEDKDCGTCFEFDLPLDQVIIGQNIEAFVLRDEQGNFYALRDIHTNEYLSEMNEDLPYFEDSNLRPNQIYEIAEQANTDQAVYKPKLRIILNEFCLSEVSLYNFKPGSDRLPTQTRQMSDRELPEPPSMSLALSALIDIAENGKPKKRNQSQLIDEILDNYQFRGLSKSNLEKMFSQANRKFTELKSSKN